MINITYIRRFVILIIVSGLFALAAFALRPPLPGKDNATPVVEITQGLDGKKNINFTITLPQIKKDIAPIAIKEFLSRIKIANADQGGLELINFEDNCVLARYGFKKGDIVKEINGQSVNTAKDAIRVCDALEKDIFKDRAAKEIYVTLDRNGEDIDMNFRIPEFVPEKVCYAMSLRKRRK